MAIVGGYEILGRLGEGGMGTVYRARDPRFDRIVALKVLFPHLASNPEIAERFKSEAVIQAKLSHPHIVSVFDFIADGQQLAFVMELVEGDPLDVWIERAGGPLPIDWCLEVMDQVLDAIGHAHDHGLIHRDIKPSNIIVSERRGKPYAKVMDFGVAKILGSEKLRTATSAKIGTLAYMSPEYIQSPTKGHSPLRDALVVRGSSTKPRCSRQTPRRHARTQVSDRRHGVLI